MSFPDDEVRAPADPVLAAAILRDVAGDATVGEAIGGERISTRLRNLLAGHKVARRALAEILLDRIDVDRSVRTAANVGRKTRVDFWKAVLLSLARRLHDLGYDEPARMQLAGALAIDAGLLQFKEDDASLLRPHNSATASPNTSRPTKAELLMLAYRALKQLPARDRDIIDRRFAACPDERETLEQIGERLGLTRERVRQLEKRALGEIKRRLPRDDLRALLLAWGSAGWEAIAGDADILRAVDLPQVARRLHGSVLLLIEAAEFTEAAWLDAIATPYTGGWLSPRVPRARVDAVVARLEGNGALRRLPRAVAYFGPFPEARAALLLTQGIHLDGGYAFASRPTARPRRAATAHAVLSDSAGPVALADLHFSYRRLVPDDPCSPRDLFIVMDEARHLFLETAEGEWVALGPSGDRPAWPRDASGADGEDDVAETAQATAEPDLTVASALQDELRRSGPQALGQLVGVARRILPAGRSANSIGPTLIGRPELFVRVLPGVYALPAQVPRDEALLQDALPFLFNEGQARLFVYGRRAAEPWGAFPLWRPETEMRLCAWARRVGADEIYRSLLAAAEVDTWPANEEYRTEWRELKRRYGRHDLLSAVKDELVYERPPLDRVLAAIVDLEARGRTSWVRLNRVLGRRIDTQVACGLLAALIALGAVDPPVGNDPCPWQLPHHVGEAAGPWREKLASAWHVNGVIAWTDPLGGELAEALRGGRDRLPSWVEAKQFVAVYAHTEELTSRSAEAIGVEMVANRRMMEFLDWLDAS